jgi:hypothetical protein
MDINAHRISQIVKFCPHKCIEIHEGILVFYQENTCTNINMLLGCSRIYLILVFTMLEGAYMIVSFLN